MTPTTWTPATASARIVKGFVTPASVLRQKRNQNIGQWEDKHQLRILARSPSVTLPVFFLGRDDALHFREFSAPLHILGGDRLVRGRGRRHDGFACQGRRSFVLCSGLVPHVVGLVACPPCNSVAEAQDHACQQEEKGGEAEEEPAPGAAVGTSKAQGRGSVLPAIAV